jgi:hypothetical protein
MNSIKQIIILAACTLSMRGAGGLVVDQVFRNSERFALVNQATSVEACILSLKNPLRDTHVDRRIYLESRYQPLPEDVQTLIVWKLLDEKNYTWDSAPACMPTYNARIRFTSGTRRLDVDFCFSCSLIRILEDGKAVGDGYFHPGSDWVFRALVTQFPRDPVIRQLKKDREAHQQHLLNVEMFKAREARQNAADPEK